VKNGVTVESLALKEAEYVADERSRPALEMPSEARREKAQKYADAWHGKLVLHVTRGKRRYGRMYFEGPLGPVDKWFRVVWEDGTESVHSTRILPRLFVVSEELAPASLPAPPQSLVVTLAKNPSVPMTELPSTEVQIRQHLVVHMSPVPAPTETVFHILREMSAWSGVDAVDSRPSTIMVAAAERLLESLQPESCLLPCSKEVPAWLRNMIPLCCLNHPPHATKPNAQHATTCMHPLSHAMHTLYAVGGGTDLYYVTAPPPLLDMLLPLSHAQAKKVVMVHVSPHYLRTSQAHRWAWLRRLCLEQLALVVCVRQADGRFSDRVWLLLFADASVRATLVPQSVNPCLATFVWDENFPDLLAPLTDLWSESCGLDWDI
jgi:hypothetical protein